jgi:hypothetical protein
MLSLSVIAVGAVVSLATGLRVFRIEHDSLIFDEAYTLIFSRMRFDRVLSVGGAHEHPPLYYLLVHLGLQARDSYLTPRLLSALAGSLSVLVLYRLGARLFGRSAGIVAATLLAISPFHLWHSQVGRGYELACLFVLTSYLCLWSALAERRRSLWLGYVAGTVLALYTEYVTALALLPQVLLWWEARRNGQARPLVWSWGGIICLYAPWSIMLAGNAGAVAADFWVPPPTPAALVNTVLLFPGLRTPCASAPCVGEDTQLPFIAGHAPLLAALVLLGAATAVLAVVVRRRLTEIVLFSWLLFPFGAILLISMRRPIYLDRSFLDATPPFFLLIGRAVTYSRSASWHRAVSTAVVAVMIAGSAGCFGAIYATNVNDPGQSWKNAALDLQRFYHSGQTVIFDAGPVRTIAGVYLPPGWHATHESLIWLGRYVDIPGWQSRFRRATEAQELKAELANATRGARSVWLFTHDTTLLAMARQWLGTHGFRLELSRMYYARRRLELWGRAPAQIHQTAAGCRLPCLSLCHCSMLAR